MRADYTNKYRYLTPSDIHSAIHKWKYTAASKK